MSPTTNPAVGVWKWPSSLYIFFYLEFDLSQTLLALSQLEEEHELMLINLPRRGQIGFIRDNI